MKVEHDYARIYVYLLDEHLHIVSNQHGNRHQENMDGWKLGSLVSTSQIADTSPYPLHFKWKPLYWSCLAFYLLILLDFFKGFLRNQNVYIYIFPVDSRNSGFPNGIMLNRKFRFKGYKVVPLSNKLVSKTSWTKTIDISWYFHHSEPTNQYNMYIYIYGLALRRKTHPWRKCTIVHGPQ